MFRLSFAPGASRSALTLMCALCVLCSTSSLALGQEAPNEGGQAGSARLTKAPTLVDSVEAEYTQEALDARLEGTVKLRLTLDAQGTVTKAEILEGPGLGLNESAQAAAMQFKFTPAEINDQPASVVLGFAINFELPVLPSEFAGTVIDPDTGQGIEGASVSIVFTGQGEFDTPPQATTLTDEQGNFFFGNVPAGPYAVTLKVSTYKDYASTIDLVAGKRSEATYKVQALPINYQGRVREAGTRKILPGVAVDVELLEKGVPEDQRLRKQTFTDAKGNFFFRGLPPGEYQVRLDTQGYDASGYIEKVEAGEVLSGDYYIEAEYYDEYTVTTTTRRARREVNRQTITLEESRRIPGTGGDIARVVQNLPGVARAPFGAGQLVVRGANPQDSAIFLQGDELPLAFHFLNGPTVVSSEMIQSLDFYPGNFTVRYGRAIGGVVNLETRSPRSDGYHGFAEVDIQDATALVEGPITEDLTFAFAARRSYIDYVLEAVLPDDFPTIAPYYYDYQAWLTYKGLEDHKLELFLYGSKDQLKILFNEPIGNEEIQITGITNDISFHRGQVRWEWRPDDKITHTFLAAVGTIGFGLDAGAVGISNDLITVNVRDELGLEVSSTATLKMGLDAQFYYAKFNFRVPELGGDAAPGADGPPAQIRRGLALDDYNALSMPAYWAELELQPVNGLLLTPGVRLDHYSNIRENVFSPRLAARYNFNKEVAIKGGIGLFTQNPDPGQTIEGLGNPNLGSEKAIHYAFGGEWRPLEYIEFDSTLFYRDSYDLVVGSNNFTVNEETGEQELEISNNDGEGRAYGLELLIRHYPNNRFFGWIAYTLSRSERLDQETGQFEAYEFDQTHILTAVAGYNLPYNFDIAARFQLVTGNPFTPVTGAVFDSDDDEYQQVSGRRNSSRSDAFQQLDIRIDKTFIFDAWRLGVYLDVQNVYWADNAEGVQYNFDSTENRPITGIPIFPNLGVNARF